MANINTTSFTTNQNFASLDILDIRNSLKSYLASRPEFVDYNFDGSIASLLLDVLAYNTQYNAFYFNQLASEHFLDTAQKRESVVSRSKEIGYLPRSARSAFAILSIQLIVADVTLTNFVIPNGTKFTTSINNVTYTFQTTQDYNSSTLDLLTIPGSAIFTFPQVYVYEGKLIVESYIINQFNIGGVNLANVNIDISHLVVTVSQSQNVSVAVPYTQATNLITIGPTSTVFFVDEINDQLYRVYFGDNTIGKALTVGNFVQVTSLISSGLSANMASTFSLASTVPGSISVLTLTTVAPSAGGDNIEATESVRFNAPLLYAAQNRAIVPKDYIALIIQNYPNIKSVVAWGGEDNIPIALGYVFISIKPQDSDAMPDSLKAIIENDLKANYCSVTILPIIVDPEIMFIPLTMSVKYNSNVATSGANTIANAILNTVVSYSNSDLNQFNQYFRYSKLSRQIDETDLSINNNNIFAKLEKRIVPDFTQARTIVLSYRNPLSVSVLCLTSSLFSVQSGATNYNNAFLQNDISGNVSLYYTLNNTTTLIQANIGTINFGTGDVIITNIFITALGPNPNTTGSTFIDLRVQVIPLNQDIFPIRNQILEIDPAEVSITMIADPIN